MKLNDVLLENIETKTLKKNITSLPCCQLMSQTVNSQNNKLLFISTLSILFISTSGTLTLDVRGSRVKVMTVCGRRNEKKSISCKDNSV